MNIIYQLIFDQLGRALTHLQSYFKEQSSYTWSIVRLILYILSMNLVCFLFIFSSSSTFFLRASISEVLWTYGSCIILESEVYLMAVLFGTIYLLFPFSYMLSWWISLNLGEWYSSTPYSLSSEWLSGELIFLFSLSTDSPFLFCFTKLSIFKDGSYDIMLYLVWSFYRLRE